MTRQEAEAHLKKAVKDIYDEHKLHRLRSAKAPGGKVKDW